jgi:hypothetical protein
MNSKGTDAHGDFAGDVLPFCGLLFVIVTVSEVSEKGGDFISTAFAAFSTFGGLAFVAFFADTFLPPYGDFVDMSMQALIGTFSCCFPFQAAAVAKLTGTHWWVFCMIVKWAIGTVMCALPLSHGVRSKQQVLFRQ